MVWEKYTWKKVDQNLQDVEFIILYHLNFIMRKTIKKYIKTKK